MAEASKIGVIDKPAGPNVWHESPGDQEAFDKDTAVPNAPESPQPPVPCTPNEIACYNLIADQDKKIKSLTEALTELVHLHACEQEGLQSGRPTPEQWFNAINKAHDALWPKSTDKP